MNRALLKAIAGTKRVVKKPQRGLRAYDEMTEPGAQNLQEALVNLIGRNEAANPETMRAVAGRMAASPHVLHILQGLPAAGVVGSAAALGDVLTGDDESFANKGMDLLGMGAGAMYGINRGPGGLGGSTLAGAGGALLGKLGSDALQGIIGG